MYLSNVIIWQPDQGLNRAYHAGAVFGQMLKSPRHSQQILLVKQSLASHRLMFATRSQDVDSFDWDLWKQAIVWQTKLLFGTNVQKRSSIHPFRPKK